jgi:hypothetical protein
MDGTSCWTVEGCPFGGLGDLVVPNWWSTVGSKRGSLEAAAACLARCPIVGVVGGFWWVVLCGDLGSSGVSLLGPKGSTLAMRGWSLWAPALAPDGDKILATVGFGGAVGLTVSDKLEGRERLALEGLLIRLGSTPETASAFGEDPPRGDNVTGEAGAFMAAFAACASVIFFCCFLAFFFSPLWALLGVAGLDLGLSSGEGDLERDAPRGDIVTCVAWAFVAALAA